MTCPILIIHPGALGDVLLSLPSLREIRADATLPVLHLAAKGPVSLFLNEVGIVEEASDLESAFYLSLYTDTPGKELAEFIRSFQKVYLFTINIYGGLSKTLALLARELKVVHTLSDKVHVALYRARQINKSTHNVLVPTKLVFCETLQKKAVEILRSCGYHYQAPLVVIHPGSGSVKKNVSLKTFFRISDYLVEKRGCFVLFLTGWAEQVDLIKGVEHYVLKSKKKVGHISMASLSLVATILQSSSLYLGNDSGISHLASLCVDRIIVFFKASNPEIWAPIGISVKVVTSDYMANAIYYIDQFLDVMS